MRHSLVAIAVSQALSGPFFEKKAEIEEE